MLKKHHQFMWSFTKSLLVGLKRPVFVYLFTLSISMVFVCSLGVYYVERGVNTNITNLFDAFYYAVTIMTGVGLGDIAPVTVWGRTLSMLMMLLGTAIFVCFTAVLAVSILEAELEHKKL